MNLGSDYLTPYPVVSVRRSYPGHILFRGVFLEGGRVYGIPAGFEYLSRNKYDDGRGVSRAQENARRVRQAQAKGKKHAS